MLVDAQLDARQRALFGIAFDPLDVPRDQFLVAGDCLAAVPRRQGRPDGLRHPRHARLWFIAGNVIRDVAALNNHEMLPWDVLGRDAAPRSKIRTRALFDRLAALSHAPDPHFDELRAVYDHGRGRAAARSFNAVRNRPEAV